MSDDLENDLRDRLVATVKGAVSMIPFVGGPLGELITHVIPRQRQDRIVEYLRGLSEKLKTLELLVVEKALSDPEQIDLIETGGYLAARATTPARVSAITQVVFNGLKEEQSDALRRKRLLGLLGEIDEDEVSLLNAYGQSYGGDGADAWEKVNRPDPPHLGSPLTDVERNALFDLGRNRLLSLGLLTRNFGTVKKGEYPEFDAKNGGFKSRLEISFLGRMLLREMGFELSFDG